MKEGGIERLERRAYVLLEKILRGQEAEKATRAKNKRNELMKQILLALVVGASLPAFILMPNLPIALRPILRNISKGYKTTNHNFIKSIKNLKKDRLITVRELDDEQEIVITDKGKKKLLVYSLDYLKLPKKENWDGKWRIIIFDIPKYLKQGRDALRQTLQRLGCFQLQKSVYIYPYSCKDEIDFIAAIFEVYPYIIYLEATFIEEVQNLKARFRIT